MSKASRLHEAVAAVCSIEGLSVGTLGDPSSIEIQATPTATVEQRAAAQSIVDNFDWSDAAQTAWEESRKPERKTMRDAAVGAIADIDAFLAIGTPTNAQTLAIVKKLCQQNRAIIRRLIQID